MQIPNSKNPYRYNIGRVELILTPAFKPGRLKPNSEMGFSPEQNEGFRAYWVTNIKVSDAGILEYVVSFINFPDANSSMLPYPGYFLTLQ